MGDQDAEWNWHDQRGVTWAAGMAVVALIVLLVWAVIETGADSSSVPGVVAPPATTAVTTSTTRKSLGPTTSYTVPSVETSEGVPPPPPPVEAPPVDEPPTDTPTSTTIPNPYLTTTPPNADAV